jgi:plastocyanin
MLVLVAFGMTLSPAGAQPRKKIKAASQSDIERLEKKIEEQQKQIDKLIRVQQQFLGALSAQFEGATPPPAPVVDPKPAPVQPAKPTPTSEKPEPKPKAAPAATSALKPESKELGTVVGKVEGAENAIVYVDSIVASVKGTATMKQEGKQFVPQTLVVTKGTYVDFPNRDAIFHNVFSATPDNSFDLGSYRQGETKGVLMSKPGVVTVYCNMHSQMVGHILVVPNGNYVRAGKDGFFRLTNVPVGTHRIAAWAPNSKPAVTTANVTANEVVTVELAVAKGKTLPHQRKDGMPYGSYEK